MISNENEMFPAWAIVRALSDSGMINDSHIDHYDTYKRTVYSDQMEREFMDCLRKIASKGNRIDNASKWE
jgi:hypothetical protein